MELLDRFVSFNGTADPMKDRTVETLGREPVRVLYWWPMSRRITWNAPQEPAMLQLETDSGNMAIGGVSLALAPGELNHEGIKLLVYGLVEQFM